METVVDRRQNLSLKDFQTEYAQPGLPVIITDATRGWKACEWTPSSLVKAAGDCVIQAQPSNSTGDTQRIDMTLADYVAYLENPDQRKLYMVSWNFPRDCPELCRDFEIPEYFTDDWMKDTPEQVRPDLMWLFLGPAGSGLYLHSDVANTSAWNVQLSGSKAWKLYPPSQECYLYEGDVNAFDPDLELCPDFAKASHLECQTGPGECLFIPSKWWHQTQNVDQGLALTANYADEYCCDNVLEWLEAQPLYQLLYRNFRRAVRKRRK
jgi:hypothetical protein